MQAGVVAAGSQAAPVQDLKVTLLGTMRNADGSGIAVIMDEQTETIIRLRLGDAHAGWQVSALRKGEVLLERKNEAIVLSLPRLAPKANGEAPAP